MLSKTRCVLLTHEHVQPDHLLNMYTNDQVRRYLGGALQQETICLDTIKQEMSEHTWGIFTQKNFIGLISLDQHHDKSSTEISYQFMPHAWGKGYAFEVATTVIDYAFKSLHLPYFVAETQTANHRSRKLLEKLNMEVTGTVQRFGESQHLYKLRNKGGKQSE